MNPLHSCIAALHKMCLRIAQLLAIKPAADARDGLLPFHRISCSPLKVLTFTPKGPRFADGPIFCGRNVIHYLRHCAERGMIAASANRLGCYFCLAESTPCDKSLTFASRLRASVRANSSKPRP